VYFILIEAAMEFLLCVRTDFLMIGDRIIKVIKRQGNTRKNKMVSRGNSEDYCASNLITFKLFLKNIKSLLS